MAFAVLFLVGFLRGRDACGGDAVADREKVTASVPVMRDSGEVAVVDDKSFTAFMARVRDMPLAKALFEARAAWRGLDRDGLMAWHSAVREVEQQGVLEQWLRTALEDRLMREFPDAYVAQFKQGDAKAFRILVRCRDCGEDRLAVELPSIFAEGDAAMEGLCLLAKRYPEVIMRHIQMHGAEIASAFSDPADSIDELQRVACWAIARSDIERAMDLGMQLKLGKDSALVADLLYLLARDDFAKGMAWCAKTFPNDRKAALELLWESGALGEQAWRQPEEMLRVVESFGPQDCSVPCYCTVLAVWLAHDPESAMAWMDKHARERGIEFGYLSDAGLLCASRPGFRAENYIPFLDRLPVGEIRLRALGDFFDAWMRQDPGSLEAWIASQPESADKRGLKVKFAEALRESDPRAYWDSVGSGQRSAAELGDFVDFRPELKVMKPAEVASIFGRLDEPVRVRFVANLVRCLAEKDLDFAKTFVAGLEGADAAGGRRELAIQVGYRDLFGGLDLASQLTDADGIEVARRLIRDFCGDPRPGGAQSPTLLSEPAGLVAGISNPAVREAVRSELVERFLDVDPETASTLLAGIGGPQDDADAVRVAKAWGRVDPDAAVAWVGTLPPSLARDRIAHGMVDGLARADVLRAFDWASGIGDAPLREDGLLRALDVPRALLTPEVCATLLGRLETLPVSEACREALESRIPEEEAAE